MSAPGGDRPLDAAVVGAGLMGASVALFLARAGTVSYTHLTLPTKA